MVLAVISYIALLVVFIGIAAGLLFGLRAAKIL